MAIKDKDGSVYRLRGPNPLLKDQKEWDLARIRLINLGWKETIVEDKRSPIQEAKMHSIDIGEELGLKENPKGKVVPAKEFISEIAQPVKQSPKIEEPVLDEPVQINVDPRMARILKERGVEYYCAPCIGYKTHTDNLYGDSYKTSVYGEQYMFDAIVIDQSDFQLQFWCVKAINKDSIAFKKDKEGGERWWRVLDVEPKTGGYLVRLNVSDSNPDFS